MTVATVHRSLFVAAAVLGLAASAFAQAALPLSAEKAALVSVTAKVQAIDQTTREVTLKGPLGNTITFTVDKRVARLNEVKVGDEVTADYYVSVAAEVRQPTDAEKATPMAVLKETAKAPAGTEPAAGVLHITKAVVTIEGLDRPTKCVTVMGPKGNLATIEVTDVANLPKLRIGDTVIVTYTEALAVSLQKRPAK
jgi:Cu/Ag efflux protein CusF